MMYMFGAFEPKKALSNRAMRRIQKIAAEHDSRLNGGEVPGRDGKYLYWFYTRDYGEPHRSDTRDALMAAIAAAGITLPYWR